MHSLFISIFLKIQNKENENDKQKNIAQQQRIKPQQFNYQQSKIFKQVFQTFTQACKRYNLVEKNDYIVVALSGGKDSYTLLYLLYEYNIKYNLNLQIIPLTILTGFGDFNDKAKYLTPFCKQLGLEHQMIGSDFNEIISNHNTDKSVCSFCARLRRGKLYQYCRSIQQQDSNRKVKLAIGHHADDCIESFLMSATQKGELFTQAPIFFSDDNTVCIIRPLILTFEQRIIDFSNIILGNNNFEDSIYHITTIDCCCPYSQNQNHNRYRIKMIIQDNFSQKGNEKQNLLNTCCQLFPKLHIEGQYKNKMKQGNQKKVYENVSKQ